MKYSFIFLKWKNLKKNNLQHFILHNYITILSIQGPKKKKILTTLILEKYVSLNKFLN